jgi:hypothetical protein
VKGYPAHSEKNSGGIVSSTAIEFMELHNPPVRLTKNGA